MTSIEALRIAEKALERTTAIVIEEHESLLDNYCTPPKKGHKPDPETIDERWAYKAHERYSAVIEQSNEALALIRDEIVKEEAENADDVSRTDAGLLTEGDRRAGVASGDVQGARDVRRPEKRCFTYCGDDKCDCEARNGTAFASHHWEVMPSAAEPPPGPRGDDAELIAEARDTTQQMATSCSVDMRLWDRHSNAVLALADALEHHSAPSDGHASDCAIHNGPALSPGPCNCHVANGTADEAIEWAARGVHYPGVISFLVAWKSGDVRHWPDYLAWLAERRNNSRAIIPPITEAEPGLSAEGGQSFLPKWERVIKGDRAAILALDAMPGVWRPTREQIKTALRKTRLSPTHYIAGVGVVDDPYGEAATAILALEPPHE